MREWFTGEGIKITHLYLMNCKIPKESMEGLMMILGERYILLAEFFLHECPLHLRLFNLNQNNSRTSETSSLKLVYHILSPCIEARDPPGL